MSKRIPVEEVRKRFLEHVRSHARYWAELPGRDEQERCDGLAFSILSMIDGCTGFPAVLISLNPHPDDRTCAMEGGEDYYEDGMVLNEDYDFHEHYYERRRT